MIYLASDHAGFVLKEKIMEYLKSYNINYTDVGAHMYDEKDDFVPYAKDLVGQISTQTGDIGILICGSGQGMCMVANRYSYIRAAQCWSIYSAQLARQDDNANVLCLAARTDNLDDPLEIVDAFLHTEFEPNEARLRRLKELENL